MNNDLSAIIGKIMANPDFGNLVKELNGSVAAPASAPAPEEAAEKIQEILSGKTTVRVDGSPAAGADAERALSALRKLDTKNCEKLLSALKPYLNSKRGDVIDKTMSFMKISDLLGMLNNNTEQ